MAKQDKVYKGNMKARIADLNQIVYDLIFKQQTHDPAILISGLQHFIDHGTCTETPIDCAEKNKTFETILNQLPDVIWFCDMDMKVNYISQACTRLMGIPVSDAVNMRADEYMSVDEFSKMVTILSEAVEEAKISAPNTEIKRKFKTKFIRQTDGEEIWVEVIAILIRDAGGKPIGIAGVTRDINDETIAQREVFTAQKLEALGQLAGGMAHDFNNLLSAMLSYLGLIKSDEQTLTRNQIIITKMEGVIKQATELIQRVLGFSRKGKLRNEAVETIDIVTDTIEMFHAARRDFSVKTKHSGSSYMEGDRAQLQQVLLNLLINSADAIDEAKVKGISTVKDISVNTRVVNLSESNPFGIPSGEYSVISVRDYGIGIPIEIQERIYDPYFTTKPHGKGSGLGLASVYGIVKNHGGCVTLRSKPDEGAQFSIYIPTTNTPKVSHHKKKKSRMHKGSGNVLIVDDETYVTDAMTGVITRMGYDVVAITDATEIKRKFKKNRFDLIFLDLTMPKMSGEEVLEYIRSIDPDQRVILQSGYTQDLDVLSIIDRLNVSAFMQKPFKMDDISEMLRRFA